MRRITLILFLILFSSSLQFVQAQNSTDTSLVRIITADGNEYTGEIVGKDSLKVYLKTNNLGEIGILKSNIRLQQKLKVQQIKDGKVWFENPQSSRYFWAPNAYGLKEGEGYYQNIWVMWNQVSYGITDNFSLGGGIIPLFLFAGAPTPIFILPKISIPVQQDKFNISAGALIGTILGESKSTFGILYGNTTVGTRDNNVTFGLGYGFAGDEWASSPMINIDGMFRLSSRGYFITENYYVNTGDNGVAVISLGGRWIIKKAALDFGLFLPVADTETFIAIPWLGFTIPFGNTN